MLNMVPFFFFLLLFLFGNNRISVAEKAGFVGRNGTQFVLNGERIYLNGFNAYWMMTTAADTASKGRTTVTTAFRQASAVGMNVARIWGFNEGDYLPLQISPGSYSEDVFKGLDFVVYEAGRYKIKLIISLVNNFEDYGGRKKYVEWAGLDEPDEFYTNSVVKQYYKNHVKKLAKEVKLLKNHSHSNIVVSTKRCRICLPCESRMSFSSHGHNSDSETIEWLLQQSELATIATTTTRTVTIQSNFTSLSISLCSSRSFLPTEHIRQLQTAITFICLHSSSSAHHQVAPKNESHSSSVRNKTREKPREKGKIYY